MQLTQKLRNALSEVIAEHVPQNILRGMAETDGIVANFDELLKGLDPDPDKARAEIARKIVETCHGAGTLPRFVNGLVRQMSGNELFAAEMSPFVALAAPDPVQGAQQAAIAARSNMFSSYKLEQKLSEIRTRNSFDRRHGGKRAPK